MAGEDAGYRWETGYEKTWEAIEEDAEGLLDSAIASIVEKSRRRRLEERRKAGNVRLGIMRHLYIVLDLSESMLDQDLKPNRLIATGNLLEGFVESFFDANPMSQLGWICTFNKLADKLDEMSGNPRKHVEFAKTIKTRLCSGEPSVQNALELATSTLKHMPNHASREILFILGSLTTCDPGDLLSTIENVKKNGIRCSVISLASEVRAFKHLCTETGGVFNVVLDDTHFRDLLLSHVEPPPVVGSYQASLMKMGFPQRNNASEMGICVCHNEESLPYNPGVGSYNCPQCQIKYCELPVECKGCGLTLVSAPHLARSFVHIFPLDPFDEITVQSGICHGCGRSFPIGNVKHIYQCKLCQKKYCLDCDLYLHEVAHCCPGCARGTRANEEEAPRKVANGKGSFLN